MSARMVRFGPSIIGWIEPADSAPVDKNGFVRDTTRLCPDCHYTKHGNGRVRRVKICGGCKSAGTERGTWSANLTQRSGVQDA